jgi:hypothetical protein
MTSLLQGLIEKQRLEELVPLALELLDRDPLASGGCFRGDILRALMELPGQFWWRYQELWEKYRSALRAAALARRRLPTHEQLEFWGVLTGEARSAV